MHAVREIAERIRLEVHLEEQWKELQELVNAGEISIQEAKEKLEKGFEELAKQAAQSGGGPADPAAAAAQAKAAGSSEKKKDEDIVDADFEVVDDDKEEKKDS